MNDIEMARIVGYITTHDESGKHFTEIYDLEVLSKLDEKGLIAIHRPVHHTGIPFGMSEWWVEVTSAGEDFLDQVVARKRGSAIV